MRDKSEALLNRRHGRAPDRSGLARFDVEGYLEHQASAFEERMDSATYEALAHAMDSFDVRGEAIGPELPALTFVGISSDWLFRAQDVAAAARRFAARGARSTYVEFASIHGHDAFLAESTALADLLRPVAISR